MWKESSRNKNLEKICKSSKKNNLIYNKGKRAFSTTKLKTLGVVIGNLEIFPDPKRVKPLKGLSPTHGAKSPKRVLGLFLNDAQWIPKFSNKISPLVKPKSIPLTEDAKNAFESLKSEVEKLVVVSINESKSFRLESDVSEWYVS